MAIIKNEIPILEFDTEQTAVLNPTHENLGLNLPKKCVFAFLGAYIDEYASKSDTKQVYDVRSRIQKGALSWLYYTQAGTAACAG